MGIMLPTENDFNSYISDFGIYPNHNFLLVQEELTAAKKTLRTLFVTEMDVDKESLLIFTQKELIVTTFGLSVNLKNNKNTQRIPTNQISDFEVSTYDGYHYISFSYQGNIHSYRLFANYHSRMKYMDTNYNNLVENGFYGLATKQNHASPVRESQEPSAFAKHFPTIASIYFISFLIGFELLNLRSPMFLVAACIALVVTYLTNFIKHNPQKWTIKDTTIRNLCVVLDVVSLVLYLVSCLQKFSVI